jgi:hypothetical protein
LKYLTEIFWTGKVLLRDASFGYEQFSTTVVKTNLNFPLEIALRLHKCRCPVRNLLTLDLNSIELSVHQYDERGNTVVS